MSFGPSQYRSGGTRGGQDQFKWDDVKSDKHRENYLGHSVQAPVGRWQKNKDLTWYTKSNVRTSRSSSGAGAAASHSETSQIQAEIQAAKRRDEQLLNEALGIVPKGSFFPHDDAYGPNTTGPTTILDAMEMKQLLQKGTTEREMEDIERIEGLGAAPAHSHEHIPKSSLAEKYQQRLELEHHQLGADDGNVVHAGKRKRHDDSNERKSHRPEELTRMYRTSDYSRGEDDKVKKQLKKRLKKEKKKQKKKQKKSDRKESRRLDRESRA